MSEIVSTADTLGGKPRINGHRIGVHHIADLILHGKYTIDDVAYDIYEDLTVADVEAALHFYFTHRETMEEVYTAIRDTDRQARHRDRAVTGPDDSPPEVTKT